MLDFAIIFIMFSSLSSSHRSPAITFKLVASTWTTKLEKKKTQGYYFLDVYIM